jgi:DNA polymerase
MAPPGHVVLAADASQIEARMVAWICGQTDLVTQFANGEDVYSSFAAKVFNKPINKKDNPDERFIGKTAILGLGYGLGWNKFQRTVKMQSRAQTGHMIELTDQEAMRIVSTYRDGYSAIPGTWRELNNAIDTLAGNGGSFTIGPCQFGAGQITLPSGLKLLYHKLKWDTASEGWMYEYGGKPKRLYGGSLLENIVQSLARVVVMDAAARLRPKLSRLGIQLALQVHDELVYVVPDDLAKVAQALLLEEMRRRPAWAPDLPLDAESSYGLSYGDAK